MAADPFQSGDPEGSGFFAHHVAEMVKLALWLGNHIVGLSGGQRDPVWCCAPWICSFALRWSWQTRA